LDVDPENNDDTEPTSVRTCEISITCPPDVTLNCDESTDPQDTGTATAAGDCPPFTITHADNIIAGGCAPNFEIERTWTVVDSENNSMQCVQRISVEDTTPPDLTVPADVTVECDASTDPSGTGEGTATDNCDPSVDVTFSDSEAPGNCPAEKVITRTWTATDDCGNSTSADQTITVVDTTSPDLTVPADVTVECDASTDPSGTGEGSATDK
jgi:hypothetical protein